MNTRETDTSRISNVDQLEHVEVAVLETAHRAAPPEIAQACGLDLLSHGASVGLVTSRIDVLALNRVVGLGLNDTVTGDTTDALIEDYRSRNVPRFFVQLGPAAIAQGLPALLESHGFQQYNFWAKLYRDLTNLPPDNTDAVIRTVDASESAGFGNLVAKAFDWPDLLAPWFSATVGQPNCRHYIAYVDSLPAAAAMLYTLGDHAWLGFAATLPAFRGRGLQHALITKRLHDAARAGCTRAVVETARDTEEKPCQSFRNLRNLGFEVAYLRPNYLFSFQSARL